MNREIKFRGKDRESWHYGDLVQEIRHNDNKLFDGTFTHIKNLEYKNGDYIGESFPVNPDTIGQYTGLHDKNGKEIYEGDIVGDKSIKWVVKWNTHRMGFSLYPTTEQIYDEMPVNVENKIHFEILGNIYDNPELLKEVK